MPSPEGEISIVVLTHDRLAELARTLARLSSLPEKPPIIVVDNASSTPVAKALRRRFPHVSFVRSARNLGAAGRNLGVDQVRTPFVAFCDDDCWWEAGSLHRGCELLRGYPKLGVISARIVIGAERRVDPACEAMARSPLPAQDLPGPALLGFMAGASIFRVDAYRAAGGYALPLFIGGEEELLALDLAVRGWQMTYSAELLLHHWPSAQRDSPLRERLLRRNALWTAWMRLPFAEACRASLRFIGQVQRCGSAAEVFAALRGVPWALRNRQVVPPPVFAQWRLVFAWRLSAPAKSVAIPEALADALYAASRTEAALTAPRHAEIPRVKMR
jgi:GT2 family glycosyltransferase